MRRRTPVVIVGLAVTVLIGLAFIMRAIQPEPTPEPIQNGMTRAEVFAIRGQPDYRRDAQLPDQFYLGVPAPYNSKQLAPGNKYEHGCTGGRPTTN